MGKKKQTIAIDIDDVLADSTEALRIEVNDRLQINLSPEHYKVAGDYNRYYANIWKQHGIEDRIKMADLEATDFWVDQHFPDTFDQILFTEESDGKTKGQICRKYGASWLIDDNVEHAQSAVDAGVEIILFGDYGWHHKAPPHFHRCRDWAQVLEYFDARG